VATVASTSTSVAADGFRDIGAGITVADRTLPLTATITRIVAAPAVAGTEPWGDVFEVTAAQQPVTPVKVRLPAPGAIPEGSAVIVMVASTAAGPWEPLETSQTLVDGKIEAVTAHFSFFTSLISSFVDLVGEATKILNDSTAGFTAEAAQPTCADEDQARATVSITSTAADTVKWCLGVENGVTILRVTNNRRYGLQASHPGLTVIDSNLDPTLAASLTAKIDPTWALLLPRRAVTFRVDSGDARLSTEFNGLSNSLYQLQIGVETLLSILTRFGAGGGDKIAKAATLLQSSKCAATLFEATGGNILANCFSPADILRAFGAKAVFAAALMAVAPLIEFFHSTFNAFGDILAERDRYEIVTTALAAPPPVVDAVMPCQPVCEITGRVPFQHPTWGASMLVTATTHSSQYCNSAGDIYVLDSSGAIRWDRSIEYGCGEPLVPADPTIDATGNLFVIYNPGRYYGVIILRPVADGIDDLGTSDFASGVNLFYYADAVDVNGDGIYEIVQSDNDCNPDCAGGTVTSVTYHWNGSGYVLP
jgi:hypothetical protein